MKDFVENIFSGKALHAKEILDERLKSLVYERLGQMKMRLVAEMYDEIGVEVDFDVEELDEANITRQGRTKIVRVRIRGGKVQRRKKLSAVKGYTIRGGKLTRMSSQERRHRKMAARRAKVKRRGKLRQALRKRKMSLRRRKAMGVR
jgi:hypothetical protein